MTDNVVIDCTTAPAVGKAAVLLFWAPWNDLSAPGGPMDTVLKTLANSAGSSSSSIVFGRVQAEDCQDLSTKYNVSLVPTFVLLNAAGDVVNRIEGGENVAQVTHSVQQLINASTGLTTAPADTVVHSKATPESATSAEERLTKRLDQLIRSSEVMLFMKGVPGAPKCGFSRQAVDILQGDGISFASFDILQDEEVRQGLKKHSNWPTYPQIYVRGELVGGLDILKEMKEDPTPLKEQLGLKGDASAPEETMSLEERLRQLINRSRIMLFMKGLPSAPRCGFSRQIVEILNAEGASYDAYDILQDEEVRQGLKKLSDWPTYPQLYVDGELVGGLDIVKEMKDDGSLTEIVKAKQ